MAKASKYLLLYLKPLDILYLVCHNMFVIKKAARLSTSFKGGGNVSTSEVILLLNLVAVVIFGVINITTKK